jgi:hypothetical protein
MLNTTTTTTTNQTIPVTRIAPKNAQRPDETASQYFQRLQDQKATRDQRARAKRERLQAELESRVHTLQTMERMDRSEVPAGKLGTDIRVGRVAEVQDPLTKEELVLRAASNIRAMLGKSHYNLLSDVMPVDRPEGPTLQHDGTTAIATGIAVAKQRYSRTGQDVLASLLGHFRKGFSKRQGKFSDLDTHSVTCRYRHISKTSSEDSDRGENGKTVETIVTHVCMGKVIRAMNEYGVLLSEGKVAKSQPTTQVAVRPEAPGVAWHGDFHTEPATSEAGEIIGQGHANEVSLFGTSMHVSTGDAGKSRRVSLPRAWRIAEYEQVFNEQGDAVSGPGFRCLVNEVTGFSYPLPDRVPATKTFHMAAIVSAWHAGSWNTARLLWQYGCPVKTEHIEYVHQTPYGASPATRENAITSNGPYCRLTPALRYNAAKQADAPVFRFTDAFNAAVASR